MTANSMANFIFEYFVIFMAKFGIKSGQNSKIWSKIGIDQIMQNFAPKSIWWLRIQWRYLFSENFVISIAKFSLKSDKDLKICHNLYSLNFKRFSFKFNLVAKKFNDKIFEIFVIFLSKLGLENGQFNSSIVSLKAAGNVKGGGHFRQKGFDLASQIQKV